MSFVMKLWFLLKMFCYQTRGSDYSLHAANPNTEHYGLQWKNWSHLLPWYQTRRTGSYCFKTKLPYGFEQGFLKVKIEGWELGSENEAHPLGLVQAFVVFLSLINPVPDILFGAFVTVIGWSIWLRNQNEIFCKYSTKYLIIACQISLEQKQKLDISWPLLLFKLSLFCA